MRVTALSSILARWIFVVGNEQSANLLRAIRTFEIERVVLFLEVTEFAKNLVEQFVQRQPARFSVGRHFAKHDHRGVAILVPHEIGGAVTIAFFAAENVERRFFQTQPARFLL